ncbi:MAG TPA: PAS domain-containing protein [Rhizomicrobium sp.]|nr:PAS domain-containing protein [Rhizomicrobium sp.]
MLALDELTCQPLRAGVAYWDSIRRDRPFPERRDLKPRDLAGIVSHMSLLKVIDGGRDFEHRIIGDAMVRSFFVPVQSRRFSDIARDAPELIAFCLPLFRQAVTTGAPVAWRHRVGRDVAKYASIVAEVVVLPLGTDKVDHLLAFGTHERSGPLMQ